MSSTLTSVLILICVFAGALIGMGLRAILPPHHRDGESRDLVKLGIGFVGTMAALLLGLLVASTKASYDVQKSEVTELSARIVFLDRVLAHYGKDADGLREQLRQGVARMLADIWPEGGVRAPQLDPSATGAEGLFEQIEALAPATESQRFLKTQAIAVGGEIAKLRWHLFEQSGTSISPPLVMIVVSWLAIIFVGFGYCAPPNATVAATLFICALSVSSAFFLILEMDRPFGGIIHIRSDAMRAALAHLGQSS